MPSIVPGSWTAPCCTAALALVGALPRATATAQQVEPPQYQSRFVEANGIRLQYMDFGGSGLPLIFVQDIHNYFEDEDPYYRDVWARFYARFTDEHRVIATVKRGYGESEDPGSGYDVATHSEDLLGLMDALGIRRAVLFGRVPATQDLTWIAEHHPERLAGLIYLGNPPVFTSARDPEARAFGGNYTRASCDLEEHGIALAGARAPWRPHFLDDEFARIDVPALRFRHPLYDRRGMDLRRLDRLDEIAAEEPECAGEARALEYFRALAADSARRAALREALEASDLSIPIDEGMARAFGVKLRTVMEPDLDAGWPEVHEFFYPHVRSFLDQVRAAEAASGSSPRRSVAFTDVTVIDPTDGTAQPDMTVVVTGDRIAAVGRTDSVPVPAGAEVIDATDRYLIPGLWDMHAHVFSDRAWWEAFLPLFVANGVTGIREMRWGVSAEAVRALEAGEVVAPPRIVRPGT